MLLSKIRGHRHVSLIGNVNDMTRPLKLLNADGEVIPQFGIYAEILSRGPFNTYKNYCYWLADFLNYLCEATCQIIARREKGSIGRPELREIIFSWHEYLTLGPAAKSEIAIWVNFEIPSRCVSTSTSQAKQAALRRFIELSEIVRQQTAELVDVGLIQEDVDREPLFAMATKFSKINAYQRNAILRSSMLAGVIRGASFEQQINQLNVGRRAPKTEDMSKIFQLERLPEFIGRLRTHRDKAIYSLYGATGCRSIEGLQLLWKDIDIEKREIRFVDPATRPTDPSYLALTHSERLRLSWKGRVSSYSLRIEPFWSMFFEHLQAYEETEYCRHNLHGFVFQKLHGVYKGQPYFLTCPSSRAEIFHSTSRSLNLPELVNGPHSIRGGYGTYLKNYYPRPDGGFGLPIEIVQKSMGHRDVRSTAKYAIQDHELAQIDLAIANSVAAVQGIKPVIKIRIEHLKAQLIKLESLTEENELNF